MKIVHAWLVVLVFLYCILGILCGCSTVHGVGEDLSTLGRGIDPNQHQAPKQIQQDSTRK